MGKVFHRFGEILNKAHSPPQLMNVKIQYCAEK